MPPKISVVTVSLNMEDYIEDTLRSVTSQNYPHLEYLVLDGGSTDRTCEIIEGYKDKLSHFSSEKDPGQYHAIARGLDMASGEVLAWINADDIFYPWTLSLVGEIFETFPQVDWITGLPSYLNKRGQCVQLSGLPAAYPQEYIKNGWQRLPLAGFLHQESMFWRKSLYQKAGPLDLRWSLASDFELWTRMARHSDLVTLTVPLAASRYRVGEQRSSAGFDKYMQEVDKICADLKPPPKVWDTVAHWGLPGKWASRFVIWKQARRISWVHDSQSWTLGTARMPISRVSAASLWADARARYGW